MWASCLDEFGRLGSPPAPTTLVLLLHLDFLSQIRGDVEVFAFNDGGLTFFKATTVDGFKLQNFLFSLNGFFGRYFFLFCGSRLSSGRTHGRLRRVDNLERARDGFHRWCRHVLPPD